MMSAFLLKIDGGVHDYKGIGIVYKPIDKALQWLDEAYARGLNWVCSAPSHHGLYAHVRSSWLRWGWLRRCLRSSSRPRTTAVSRRP